MAETPIGEHRLASLRHRWEQDPSSRIFVQLAEAHRRRGEVSEALEVLKQGLAHHPRYLSANIVQARCYLELDQGEMARKVLEAVVVRDPTHLVAGQLLVETHLQLGERPAALEALERYRLLGAGGEDFDELERRANGLARPEKGGASERTEPIPLDLVRAEPSPEAPEEPSSDFGSTAGLSDSSLEATRDAVALGAEGGEPGPPFQLGPDLTSPLNLPASPAVRSRGALYRVGDPEPFGPVVDSDPLPTLAGPVFHLDTAVDPTAGTALPERPASAGPPLAMSSPPARPAADRTWKGSSSEFSRGEGQSTSSPPSEFPVAEFPVSESQAAEKQVAQPEAPAESATRGIVDASAEPKALPTPPRLDAEAEDAEPGGEELLALPHSQESSAEAVGPAEPAGDPAEPESLAIEEMDDAATESTSEARVAAMEADEVVDLEVQDLDTPEDTPEESVGTLETEPELEATAPTMSESELDVSVDETNHDDTEETSSYESDEFPEEVEAEVEIEEHDINEAVASIIELDIPSVPMSASIENAIAAAESAQPPVEPESKFVPEVEEAREEAPERVTATLGDLYRRQGHLEEARRVYQQVLEAEPENAEALAGLTASSPQSLVDVAPTPAFQREVTAQDLIGDEAVHERGLTARKLVLLQQYLSRIQGKGEQDVPREAE